MKREPTPANPAVLATVGIVTAASVIVVALLGGSWARVALSGLITLGVLIAAGTVGALVKFVSNKGN
ncbi:hypothetical protein [Streptomyces sp. NPDC048527]|uniref:hypothetical protein n=1 Tax=Streptomyces sp. NPDC048527 TaxID=3365568 RepID=UPI003722CCD0